MAANRADGSWFDSGWVARPAFRGMVYSSRYLTMRDGVRIAIDLYLPAGLTGTERLPAILHQTRYYRSMELRWPLRLFLGGKPFDHTTLYARRRRRFVTSGYAWIDVDVRGSGASYGTRVCEWSPDEVRDGAEIVDWIVRQPWSSGRVGAMGISYDGSAAEFLLVNRHPAVRAIAPRFALFDAYTDIAFPGGIHAIWFTENWGRHNDSLDRNAPHEVAGWWVKLAVTGVQPVQDDRGRALRAGAIRAHRENYDVHAQASALTHRDDVAPSDPYHHDLGVRIEPVGTPADTAGSIGLFSPHNYWRDVEASGAAIYNYSGWLDGAYPHAAIKRFLTIRTPGSRLILGPWNHGGGWNVEQLQKPSKSAFDHDGELLRFFNHHLTGADSGIATELPVHYFTMAERRWKSAATWPPPAVMRSFYLGEERRLSLDPPMAENGVDEYHVDQTAGSGEQSRWRTQVGIDADVRYPDRAYQDAKLLVYTSAPLDRPIEVTGHAVVTLYVTSSANDATFFVYLEDVAADGRIAYVTEGELRALHRRLSDEAPPYRLVVPYRTFTRRDARLLTPGEVAEVTFDLLPTSYMFQRGHCIRLAIAGADASHFAQLPGGPPRWAVHRSPLRASRITLPVVTA